MNKIKNLRKQWKKDDIPQDIEESSGDERTTIRSELSTMAFEDLIKLKEKLGANIYNEAIFGSTKKDAKKVKTDFKRANKNRPREMSSKYKVPLLDAQSVKTTLTQNSDPRFDSRFGEYNANIFKQNYSFIKDVREKDISKLKANIHASEDPEERQNIKLLIQRLENQNREEIKYLAKQEQIKLECEDIQKAKQEGRVIHYKTKRERKAEDLVRKFEELKQTGKLNKHIEKRRKKNAAKDRKKLKLN